MKDTKSSDLFGKPTVAEISLNSRILALLDTGSTEQQYKSYYREHLAESTPLEEFE